MFTGPVVVAGAWAGGWLPWLTEGASVCLGGVWLVFVATATIGIAPLFERPKRIGVAIGRLIAGVAMLDALTIAASGWVEGVVIAACCAVLTRIGQRYVPGT
jgi:hypothetical protein